MKTFTKGSLIFEQDEQAQFFYLIEAGQVALKLHSANKSILIETLGAESILGVSWLVPPYHWSFDAFAIEDTTTLAIDAAAIRGLCEVNHELGFQLLRKFSYAMVDRLQATRIQLLDLYQNPGSEK